MISVTSISTEYAGHQRKPVNQSRVNISGVRFTIGCDVH